MALEQLTSHIEQAHNNTDPSQSSTILEQSTEESIYYAVKPQSVNPNWS